MHQIRFRLRLCPRPRWESYSTPQTSRLDLRGLLVREGRELREGQGRGRMEGRGPTSKRSRGERGESSSPWCWGDERPCMDVPVCWSQFWLFCFTFILPPCAFETVSAIYLTLNVYSWRCWLGGREGIRPVKIRVVGCWHGYLSGVRCRLAYGPADATATHCLLLQ